MTSHYGEGQEPQQRAQHGSIRHSQKTDRIRSVAACHACSTVISMNTGPPSAEVETALICCVQRFIILIICAVDAETLYRPTGSTLKNHKNRWRDKRNRWWQWNQWNLISSRHHDPHWVWINVQTGAISSSQLRTYLSNLNDESEYRSTSLHVGAQSLKAFTFPFFKNPLFSFFV